MKKVDELLISGLRKELDDRKMSHEEALCWDNYLMKKVRLVIGSRIKGCNYDDIKQDLFMKLFTGSLDSMNRICEIVQLSYIQKNVEKLKDLNDEELWNRVRGHIEYRLNRLIPGKRPVSGKGGKKKEEIKKKLKKLWDSVPSELQHKERQKMEDHVGEICSCYETSSEQIEFIREKEAIKRADDKERAKKKVYEKWDEIPEKYREEIFDIICDTYEIEIIEKDEKNNKKAK